MYHERQRRAWCLVHSLNALVQAPRFTPGALDDICDELSRRGGHEPCSSGFCGCLNPHRGCTGEGDYDANVLAYVCRHALAAEMHWATGPRHVAELLRPGACGGVRGVVANVPVPVHIPLLHCEARRVCCLCCTMRPQHWFCAREAGGVWYNFDSRLPAPALIGDRGAALRLLAPLAALPDHHIFVVVSAPDAPHTGVVMSERVGGGTAGGPAVVPPL